jgi:hypothetical protein
MAFMSTSQLQLLRIRISVHAKIGKNRCCVQRGGKGLQTALSEKRSAKITAGSGTDAESRIHFVRQSAMAYL